MARRTECYDDPDAPKPNSLVVAASAVVTDEAGRILPQRRRDNDLWVLPGGGADVPARSRAVMRQVHAREDMSPCPA